MAEKQSDKPFHVVTHQGTLHSGWDTLEQATHAANEANIAAQKIGIETRYSAEIGRYDSK